VVEKQLLQSDFLIGDFLTLADIVLVRWAAV
jgi:glutathione S-transferase